MASSLSRCATGSWPPCLAVAQASSVSSTSPPATGPQTRVYGDYIQPSLWINLQGREPQGIVPPGAAYEDLRDEVIDRLQACRDLATGEPVANAVYRREQVYYGPEVERAPDLIIDWNYRIVCSGYRSPLPDGRELIISRGADLVERRNVTGDHHPDGILLLAGPGIRAGQEVHGARIADIAPTLLYLLDLPVPEAMDGQVLSQALDPALLAGRPVQYRAQTGAPASAGRTLSAAEEEQVLSRLRDLGYVD